MRHFDVKAWLVALLIALVPCIANAVGLGRLTMLSALGDRLDAEIELVSVTKEELATISARLSSPDAYKQANLQYNAALVGARVSVERRQSGTPYIKITSARPVTEPFIDVLVELTSSSGRLVREYTVLVDPPGTAPAATASAPAPRPVPAQAVPAPAVATPAPAARKPAAAPAPMAGAKEYGPIKKGETLSSIAKSVAPDGVTLDQVMIGLYRSNPDAFINKNLNMVKAGRILRVPEKNEIAAVAPTEATKEFKAQVADWNSYRQNVAGSPGTARAEGRTTTTGRITAKVEEKAGDAPRDVVKLSKGEPAGGEKGKARGADRLRALEEEVRARDQALAEANERISQLEKTIKDMQKLAELKSPGMAAAQQKAEQATAQPAPKPEARAEARDAPKSEPVPAPKPEADKAPAQPEAEKAPAKSEAEKIAAAPKAEKAAAAGEPKAKPKPQVASPPPPPSPSMMDQVLEAATDPLYLGAGGGLIALGGLAFWMARRRRGAGAADSEPARAAPHLARAPAVPVSPDTTMAMPVAAIAAATAVPAAAAIDEVDPLAEAEVYIAYGRDAQAEEILKDALVKNPHREDAQLKLLEIYSARKDMDSFNKVATELNKQTRGAGDNWLAAAAMGYALDPNNALYEAGRYAAPAGAATAPGGDLDFDLGGDTTGLATDITLDSGAAGIVHDSTAQLDANELRSMAAAGQKQAEETTAPLMPDFSLDIPAAGGQDAAVTHTDISLDATVPTQDGHMIDFQIELPKEDAPETIAPAPSEAPITDIGLDFKLDIPDLDLGDKTAPETLGGGEKDAHWYDVQTKFDLAKAYQEMGDKDGAREILQEVIKEGDIEQQSQAQKLLESLA